MKEETLELKTGEYEIEINEDTNLKAIFIGKKDDRLDMKVTFLHKNPNIKSRINIKAVLFDNSHFDLEALLKIAKGAIGTDTYLKINCLVLSDNTYTRAIPSLEINESEVKGGHGATIGYIDPTEIYYLTSHGLNPKEAEELIVDAFIKA